MLIAGVVVYQRNVARAGQIGDPEKRTERLDVLNAQFIREYGALCDEFRERFRTELRDAVDYQLHENEPKVLAHLFSCVHHRYRPTLRPSRWLADETISTCPLNYLCKCHGEPAFNISPTKIRANALTCCEQCALHGKNPHTIFSNKTAKSEIMCRECNAFVKIVRITSNTSSRNWLAHGALCVIRAEEVLAKLGQTVFR